MYQRMIFPQPDYLFGVPVNQETLMSSTNKPLVAGIPDCRAPRLATRPLEATPRAGASPAAPVPTTAHRPVGPRR